MVREDETKTIVDPTDFINEFLLACNSVDNAFESFDQRKLHDSIYINQQDGRLLTLSVHSTTANRRHPRVSP